MLLNLPTPEVLAKKEKTRIMSMRFKESTILEFEKYAQIYQTTASALINNLLEAYIQEQENNKKETDRSGTERRASRAVMSQYLEKLASKVGKMPTADLSVALAKNYEYSNVDHIDLQDYEGWIEAIGRGECSDYTVSVFMGDDLHSEFMCSDNQNLAKLIRDDDLVIVSIPANKYAIVGNMALGYVTENEILYKGKRGQKIDIEALNKIIEIVNTTEDGVELAKQIGKVFSNYESLDDLQSKEQ